MTADPIVSFPSLWGGRRPACRPGREPNPVPGGPFLPNLPITRSGYGMTRVGGEGNARSGTGSWGSGGLPVNGGETGEGAAYVVVRGVGAEVAGAGDDDEFGAGPGMGDRPLPPRRGAYSADQPFGLLRQ
ncbi:hypothetical protein GCM10010218_01950 [Streptomyces mashuensis]|uniref:Uncharacterized protein n=1 Tax=Streptomyces mashuensis TaxID=33904 RepID=A0A919AV06_9ACTN|nr:hypothetical protein GCM10010218_01950 [Streptomyces mashuensis]